MPLFRIYCVCSLIFITVPICFGVTFFNIKEQALKNIIKNHIPAITLSALSLILGLLSIMTLIKYSDNVLQNKIYFYELRNNSNYDILKEEFPELAESEINSFENNNTFDLIMFDKKENISLLDYICNYFTPYKLVTIKYIQNTEKIEVPGDNLFLALNKEPYLTGGGEYADTIFIEKLLCYTISNNKRMYFYAPNNDFQIDANNTYIIYYALNSHQYIGDMDGRYDFYSSSIFDTK